MYINVLTIYFVKNILFYNSEGWLYNYQEELQTFYQFVSLNDPSSLQEELEILFKTKQICTSLPSEVEENKCEWDFHVGWWMKLKAVEKNRLMTGLKKGTCNYELL